MANHGGEESTNRHYIGGVPVASSNLDSAANFIIKDAVGNHGHHIHLVNAYSIACASKNPQVQSSLTGDAVNFPDGKPLYWIGRHLQGDKNFHQVRGPALFSAVIESSTPDTRHLFIGSTPEVLKGLKKKAESENPSIQIVAMDSPPFAPLDLQECERRNNIILQSKANLVWVGLGTPKQDLEARRIATELGVTSVAVGAAFDFYAGQVEEAPLWMQRIGFEWSYRLIKEPRRLWKRYLLGNFQFLYIVASRRSHSNDD